MSDRDEQQRRRDENNEKILKELRARRVARATREEGRVADVIPLSHVPREGVPQEDEEGRKEVLRRIQRSIDNINRMTKQMSDTEGE